jgi:hypothetical protein
MTPMNRFSHPVGRRPWLAGLAVSAAVLAADRGCKVLAAAEANGVSQMVVGSPKDYQVWQRQSARLGAIGVSGSSPPGADRIEARLTGTSPQGALSGT